MKYKVTQREIFISEDWLCMQWQPTPVLLPGKSHGWRSLVGCSPWGREESDTTERLHFHFSLPCTGEGNGNPLQCSCLENPGDRRAWWAAVYGVAQSRTRLKWLSSSSSMHAKSLQLFPIFATPWTIALQASLSMAFPGKNTEMGCHACVQEIFLTQGSNPHFLHFLNMQAGSLPPVPPGKPERWLCAQSLSRCRLFETPWIVARQAPLSMEFSRQELWSGLPFPSPKTDYKVFQTLSNTRNPVRRLNLSLCKYFNSSCVAKFQLWTMSEIESRMSAL